MSKKMINRRDFLKISAITTAGTLLASCSSANETVSTPTLVQAKGPLTVFAHTSTQSQFFHQYAPVFTEDTGIEVEIIEVPFAELLPKMMVELSAGTGNYDVIALNSILSWVGQEKFMISLDDLYTSDIVSDLSAASIEAASDADGVKKAFPFIASLPANFYRTDLFDEMGVEPPTTWDETIVVGKALTFDKDGTKIWGTVVEAGSTATTPAVKLLHRFYQAGGGLVDDSGNPVIDQEANIEAVQWTVDLVHKHKIAPPEAPEMIYEDMHNMFIQGRAATALNWQYMVSLAGNPESSEVVDKFAVTPDVSYKQSGVNVDFWMFAVPEASKHQDEAKEWIRRTTEPAQQKELLKTEGLVARLSAMDPSDPEVIAINPYIEAFTDSMVDSGIVAPRWPSMNDVLLRLAAALNAAMTQTKTPAEALKDAQSEIVELVA